MQEYKIALIGNSNVGKRTIFNALTGKNQHSGPWPGTDLTVSKGKYLHGEIIYHLYDFPAITSYRSDTQRAVAARKFIFFEHTEAVIIICDATCLNEILPLVLETKEITPNIIVCLTFIEKAKKKNLVIHHKRLSRILNVPVIPIGQKSKQGLFELIDQLDELVIHNKCNFCMTAFEEEESEQIPKGVRLGLANQGFAVEDFQDVIHLPVNEKAELIYKHVTFVDERKSSRGIHKLFNRFNFLL